MGSNSIRAVLFDFGGVLATEGFREGLADLARRQGLNPQAVHQAAADAIYESGYIVGRGTAKEFWRILCDKTGLTGDASSLFDAIAERFHLRPRMFDLVRALRNQGYTTAILSDQSDWLDRLDGELKFFRMFDRVYNSYHLGKGKRDPSIFDDVALDLGLITHAIAFVDDDQGNVERARSRGIKAVLFQNEDQCVDDLESIVGHSIMER
ncbi:MAG: HAD family phosphatase [Deltaproteobacteria bacterium]|nr:HAD family phosphatase [Deltaproteobacteria bacterium]